MKKASVLTAILIVLMIPSIANAQARYVIITDSAGKEHRHELAADGYISTYRSDGSDEVGIFYENGALRSVDTRRPDDTTEALIRYENGAFNGVGTFRPDDTIEAIIDYENGAFNGVSTTRPDNTTEAQIDYENGRILNLSVANPDRTGASDGEFIVERQITFRNGYPVCQ